VRKKPQNQIKKLNPDFAKDLCIPQTFSHFNFVADLSVSSAVRLQDSACWQEIDFSIHILRSSATHAMSRAKRGTSLPPWAEAGSARCGVPGGPSGFPLRPLQGLSVPLPQRSFRTFCPGGSADSPIPLFLVCLQSCREERVLNPSEMHCL